MTARAAAPLGWPFEILVAMTNTLTLTDGATNLVYGSSGLSGGKTLTLPSIQGAMVPSQNAFIIVANKSDSGGTITVAAASGDSIIGTATVAAGAIATTFRHDALHQWFAT